MDHTAEIWGFSAKLQLTGSLLANCGILMPLSGSTQNCINLNSNIEICSTDENIVCDNTQWKCSTNSKNINVGFVSTQAIRNVKNREVLENIVNQGEISKAIGIKGKNAKNIENLLKKKIKIIEFNSDPIKLWLLITHSK